MIDVTDDVFEPPIGFQTSGGPGWRTEIVTKANGGETRNALWAGPLRRWQVGGVPLDEAAAQDLVRFFNARSGKAQGFRFRDPFGWRTAAVVTALDQALGTGDGETTEFQLLLDDGSGASKAITRPVAGSVRLAEDGVEISAFSVDGATGLVTFDDAPANGAVLTAGFEYDLPVRFENDRLELTQSAVGALQLMRLSLVEVREGIAW